ncbi:putative bifunctional diguanylate cyclase/phosphodiesterase [Amphritea sp. HPY]|uniref:putative bifunctional diguanylate cyclase/phosphodiesterase n=1 Tax=Amphritea sp. HPY TaxID=3421652 RepID=UPI003D7E4004
MSFNYINSIRGKLISIFIFIKVIPLIVIALFAWQAATVLSEDVTDRSAEMADGMLDTIQKVGDTVIHDSTEALDDRSQEAIERLTTDTAQAVARFLYQRDQDILLAATLQPSIDSYRNFLSNRNRALYQHGAWQLAEDQQSWVPVNSSNDPLTENTTTVNNNQAELIDNGRRFTYRPPEGIGQRKNTPLYREITVIGLDGQEQFNVSNDGQAGQLIDTRDRLQTFAKAETYWPELQALQPGQIYVSEVIGEYVKSSVIGPYTPATAAAAGIEYAPEQSAYAGKENPLGKHFQGIIRWATPLVSDGKITGYITLALDHDHIRQFTDRILPTGERYTPIAAASEGNYAFMWDYKNRAISHPRDYFIHGYNSTTGLPETPWLDQNLYQQWQASGLPSQQFLAGAPIFNQPSRDKKPAQALVRQGTVALDCRYLNFSPQCQGWHQLTRDGGSGSFLIYFSGLWKFTTAAAIPYYTGRYGDTGKGFGIVTIGANFNEFHQAAVDSGNSISNTITDEIMHYGKQRDALTKAISRQLNNSTLELTISTAILVLIVIAIAFWMANALTRRITTVNQGIQEFHNGNLKHRLEVNSQDEMGQLAGSFNAMAGTIEDSIKQMSEEISLRRKNEQQLRVAAVAFETQEGMCITDADNVILSVNQAFTEITGYIAEEAIGQTPKILRSGNHTAEFYMQIKDQVHSIGQWQGEIWCQRKNGEIFPEWLTITEVTDGDGKVTHYVRALTDISERKASEEHIKQLAYFDSLTNLPNRRLLTDRLEQAIQAARRHGDEGALLFIDLDNFKALNDTAGHHHGDILLQQVAERLSKLVRKTDTVARFGGDEFVVMLTDLAPERDAAMVQIQHISEKILETLNQPYSFAGFEHHSTQSIGITLFSDNNQTGIEQLMQRADLAMYQAKAAGRNAIRFFDPQMQAAANSRAELEADLHIALREQQFQLHYQPQVDSLGKIIGFEALIRWHHPDKGMISPLDFIPVAEETGQILPIGLWVLETACEQLKKWHEKPQYCQLTVSVNVSTRQYQQVDFVARVIDIVLRHGIDPVRLHLELTESVLSDNIDDIVSKMWQLREIGIGFALDDFGTGYSSLSYLKKLPLDYLKIDQSFVRDLLTDANDAVLAQTIIGLAYSMNIGVIAEGVETEEQRQRLFDYRCNTYQGYLFGRPLPVDQLVFDAVTDNAASATVPEVDVTPDN